MVSISAEVSYIEIGVSDASKSRAFLEQMFGWKFHPFGQGAEGWFQTPSLKAGIHGGDPNWGFLVYFGVPDLEVAIADGSRGNLVLENLLLRQQVAVLKRRHRRPSIGLLDKLFWVVVRRGQAGNKLSSSSCLKPWSVGTGLVFVCIGG